MRIAGLTLFVAALLLVAPAPASAQMCVGTTEAVTQWIQDRLPQANMFTSEQVCNQGCYSWWSGCFMVSIGASMCERFESIADNGLNMTQCFNQSDPAILGLCFRLVGEKRTADAMAVSSELAETRTGCSAGLDLCLARCESFHGDE